MAHVRRLVSFAVGLYVLVVGTLADPPHLGLVVVGAVLMGLITLEQVAAAFHDHPRRDPK